jgi:hypothetical protein
MEKNITVSADQYKRLEALAEGFDTPTNVIERLLNYFENSADRLPKVEAVTPSLIAPVRSLNLEVVFIPNTEIEFKNELLKRKVAWIKLYKVDNSVETKMWKAQSFTQDSDLMGNLRSGYLRGWKDKGICKAVLAIRAEDLPA